ncbi:hypothetical protein FF38_02010 [Lucilia cuprina]|uniref:Luciferin 4-monooxygenase n=1 Tax=Lucilia cuprina TaxID=7375 RepID=A0A0L0BLP2_LUCCU|nr:hypothetical protein FF38_02010 [Lucilia cuprina]
MLSISTVLINIRNITDMLPLTATYYDPIQKLWSGPVKKDLYNENITLGEVIFLELSKHPQKLIQINDSTNEEITAQQFLDHVMALSDVVGMYANNATHTATVMVAAYFCGTPVNALYPGFDKDSAQLFYKVTRPKIIFCDVENYEIAVKVNQDLQLNAPIYTMNGEVGGVSSILSLVKPDIKFRQEPFAYPCVNLKGDDTAVILCSSGTTGIPKGVLCSHRAFPTNFYNPLKSSLNLKSDSVVCTFSTMYWSSGLWSMNASLITCCLRIITDKPFTGEYFLQLIERHQITNMQQMVIFPMNENWILRNGEFLGPNEHGEIIINTPYKWFGYYHNEAASKKAYIGNWLHSGDIGFFDDDGFLHVCARDNDVFKARNFQIYPPLIGDVVMQVAGVFEACVFGIPDLMSSHLITCAVVRTANDIGRKLSAKEIISHVKTKMGNMYHLSGGVYFLDAIPKTGSGKVQRAKVTVMFPLTATHYNPQKKLWSGPEKKDLYNENMTLGEVTYLEFVKNPQKVIQINDTTKEQMTAQEFLLHVRALSKNLLKMGLKAGDVVGMYANNATHTATIMMAAYLCGTPVNALYPGFDKDNVQLIYKVTTPKIIFCDVENYEIAFKVCKDLNLKIPIYTLNGEIKGVSSIMSLVKTETESLNEPFEFPCVNLKGDDTAIILCSSGTTGTPKGVLCSHRALNLKSDSVLCTFSTMYWASGLWNLNASLINCCLRIITNKAFTPEYFLQLIERHQITHMITNGSHMAELVMYDDVAKIQKSLASIDTFVVGGSKVPLIVQEKMIDIMKVNNKRPGFGVAYGMSELSTMLSFNGGYICEQKVGSEGKLTANKQVRIINKEGDFLGPNEHGEIIIYTPYQWFGYYRNEDAYKKAYKDNWLYTGDIGFFDDDGFLHVCARDNDVFKARNFQIYPQLIEDIVLQVPGVFEACVFGIPDLVASHLITCAVVRKEDDSGRKLTAKEIISYVESKMGSMYHLTGGVYFIDAIPKTGSGKVQRRKVLDVTEHKMQPLSGTFYDASEKIWHGPKRKDLYNSKLAVGEVAIEQLRQNPHKIIQIMDSTGETLTAQELVDYSLNLSRNLLSLGLKPKDVIGLYAQNSTHVATVMLASFLCGTPVNALFPAFDVENVALIYNNTRPKVIFCDVENYENARAANENLNLNAFIYLMNDEIAGVRNIKELLECDHKLTNGELSAFRLPCLDMNGDDTAIILCSSGTTGTPKGVIPNTTVDSVVFNFSTMYWASGVLTLLSSLFHCLTRVITNKPFTPEYFLYLVEKYKITHSLCTGSQMAELVINIEPSKIRKSLRSIDSLMCGGSKVPEIVQKKMVDILSDNPKRPGFLVAYGMSELCGWLSLSGAYPYEFGELSEGKLAPNDKVRIVDKQGNFLGPNESGEILVCSPYRFVGYFNNPEATKKALNGDWLYSGDIGYFDEQGFLHVCGRDKDVFKSFNFQIYPQLIEDYILKIPGVAEVCVVGIPDLVASNLTACVVVRKQDESGLALTAEAIDQYIKDNMANMYHLKGGVYFVDSLPKTGSDKIQRKLVLDLINKS